MRAFHRQEISAGQRQSISLSPNQFQTIPRRAESAPDLVRPSLTLNKVEETCLSNRQLGLDASHLFFIFPKPMAGVLWTAAWTPLSIFLEGHTTFAIVGCGVCRN